MNKELMITKEDLVNWLDRPPSNDDLDLIGFITTRLENFYKLEQELNQKNKIIEELSNELNDYIKEYEPEKWEDMCRNREILEELEKGSEDNE